ncbi:unnamed protein product [Rangifer tarandus platyrhynchus]|uniref:Secreted protein n=2 Tax=Rangifer tarandus platyrhynchus TaxID=3082113 RepID=A0ABN8ZVF5_RANTA|nr:unnamed protein product [Rangifer tarandus platyrhynchus]CAI9709293.1 unnamed protein product [Rangifer tarandus platyrhynchus]
MNHKNTSCVALLQAVLSRPRAAPGPAVWRCLFQVTAGDRKEVKTALEPGSLDNKDGVGRESSRRNFQQRKNRKRKPRCADAECRSPADIVLEREGVWSRVPFGMQRAQSCKTDRINMKRILLKSRRYNRGQPERYKDSSTLIIYKGWKQSSTFLC